MKIRPVSEDRNPLITQTNRIARRTLMPRRLAVAADGVDVRELSEIRWMIEPQAVALAAERATAEDLAEIAEAYAPMAAADPAGDSATDADLRFHRAILAAGHNDLLLQMSNLIGLGLLPHVERHLHGLAAV